MTRFSVRTTSAFEVNKKSQKLSKNAKAHKNSQKSKIKVTEPKLSIKKHTIKKIISKNSKTDFEKLQVAKEPKESKRKSSINHRQRKNGSEKKFKRTEYILKQHDEKCKKFMIFLCDETASLLFLRENENVMLGGSGTVQCLHGRCCINGFEFNTQNAHKFPVYSLHPQYSIQALKTDQFQPLTNVLEKYYSTNEHLFKFKDIVLKTKTKYAVILFEKCQNTFLAKMADLKSYNKVFNFTAPLTAVEGKEEVSFGEEHFKVLQAWKHQFLSKESVKLVVVGERNTGKSSFIRYLINQSLSFLSQVAYLECDPGQTEFAAPGCVALNIVTTPFLGLPFTNTTSPTLSCFTGSVSPSQHPHHFMACIQFVLERYTRDYATMPLVVNTMGWMQGKGMELLCALLQKLCPSMVVQLYDKQLEPLLPPRATSLHHNSLLFQPQERDEDELAYQHFSIKTLFNPKRCSDGKTTPACLRNLKLLSCLYQTSPLNGVFTDQLLGTPIYCMQGVTLRMCHGQECALDACVVSLCCLSEGDDVVCESIGMGVVHAVSSSDRVYVTTNVLPSSLSTVNCLLAGSVKIPLELLEEDSMRSVNKIGVNYQKDVFGSSSLKSLRKFIPRKKILNK